MNGITTAGDLLIRCELHIGQVFVIFIANHFFQLDNNTTNELERLCY